jgi:uncharacterized membrane protein
MAFCAKCGSAVNEGAPFCSACGAPQTGATAAAPPPPPPQQQAYVAPAAPAGGNVQPQQQMAENVAGFLCYLVGWITGLIFFLIDKRPYVRFHAAQSIVLFGGFNILIWVFGAISVGMLGFGGFHFAGFLWLISILLDLGAFVLWILLMVKAYQGERFRVPVVADIAEQIFGKS